MAQQDSVQDPNHRQIDIKTATLEHLAANPVLGRDGAESIINNRALHNWDEVLRLPGFDHQTVRNLKKTGAQIGSGESRSAA